MLSAGYDWWPYGTTLGLRVPCGPGSRSMSSDTFHGNPETSGSPLQSPSSEMTDFRRNNRKRDHRSSNSSGSGTSSPSNIREQHYTVESRSAVSLPPAAVSCSILAIDAVYLIIHTKTSAVCKLLVPAPPLSPHCASRMEQLNCVDFCRELLLIDSYAVSFRFDFRVSCPQRTPIEQHAPINLTFHEYWLRQGESQARSYIENMTVFGLNTAETGYSYTTNPIGIRNIFGDGSTGHRRRRHLRLEMRDMEKNAWFIGKWRVKVIRPGSQAERWLQRANLKAALLSLGEPTVSPEMGRAGLESFQERDDGSEGSSDKDGDFSIIDSTDFQKESQPSASSLAETMPMPIQIPMAKGSFTRNAMLSGSPSRSSSPRTRPISPLAFESSNTRSMASSPARSLPPSILDSFEDLTLTSSIAGGMDDEERNQQDEMALPAAFADTGPRLSIASPKLLPRKSKSDAETTVPEPASSEAPTVDILQQVGSLLFSTNVGQFVAHTVKSDPREKNVKASFSTSSIHLLGVRYHLQQMLSNVIVMETAEDGENGNDSGLVERNERSNEFARIAGRIAALADPEVLLHREVVLLKKSGPVLTKRLRNWFELFGWQVNEFSPAAVKVSNHLAVNVEVKVFALIPVEQTDTAAQPGGRRGRTESFLADVMITFDSSQVGSDSDFGSERFLACSRANAYFVEIMAFLVQTELNESHNPPEIVLLESWTPSCSQAALFKEDIEPVPVVKYSAIPDTDFSCTVYFWSDHLQTWLLQGLNILSGGLLAIHPLIDAKLAIQIHLAGCNISVLASEESAGIGLFSLTSASGFVAHFRVVQLSDLKAIVGRIRFLMLKSPQPSRATTQVRRSSSLLEAERLYCGPSAGVPVPYAGRGSDTPLAFKGDVHLENIRSSRIDQIRNANLFVLEAFLEDFVSRFWMTYRKQFARIGPSLFTTDLGWGCMLRTGQCMMAEALCRFRLGRGWRLRQLLREEAQDGSEVALMRQIYLDIANVFADEPHAPYSVHQLALEGAKIGTPIGQWFGPSVLGKVLKSICNVNQRDSSPFWIFLSQDGVFLTEHLLKVVARRAVLILMPLRLGLERFNPLYGHFVKACLRLPASLGIVGGLPSRSLYFVGYQDNELLFLDPHILKPNPLQTAAAGSLAQLPALNARTADLHTNVVRSIGLEDIDPSMLIGFLCTNAEEVVQLRDQLVNANKLANILSIK